MVAVRTAPKPEKRRKDKIRKASKDDPKKTKRFNWAEFHLFVSNTEETDPQNLHEHRRHIQRIH